MVSADPLGGPNILPRRLDSSCFWRGSDASLVDKWSIGSKPSPFLPPEGRPRPAGLVLLQTRYKVRLEEHCEVGRLARPLQLRRPRRTEFSQSTDLE